MSLRNRCSQVVARLTRGRIGGGPPVVAVVRLTGVIAAHAGRFRPGVLNLADMADTIERAFSVPGAKAVALAINSPGGSPVQSSLLFGRIRALAAEKKLPVYAFAEDVAASGGYWLACAGDEIYADGASIIGSIGVISASFGFTGLMEKLGIERRAHAQGDRKLLLDPFAPEKAEDVARLEAIQKDIHRLFIDHVKRCRGSLLAAPEAEIFSGDVWTARQAQQMGLIDGIGDMRSVLRRKFGEKVQIRLVGGTRNWLQRRLGIAAPPPAEWAAGLLDEVGARALWGRFGL